MMLSIKISSQVTSIHGDDKRHLAFGYFATCAFMDSG